MSNIIVVGIILAFAGILVYLSRKLGRAESDFGHEKATSQGLQEVAKDRIQNLEKGQLNTELEIRNQEHEEEQHARDIEDREEIRVRGGRFYPDRLRKYPKDPNDLN